jgi:hypothetical protein
MQISTSTQTAASQSTWTLASDKRTSSAAAFEDRTAGINLLRDSELLMLMDARNVARAAAERGLVFLIEPFMNAICSFVSTVEAHAYLTIEPADAERLASQFGQAAVNAHIHKKDQHEASLTWETANARSRMLVASGEMLSPMYRSGRRHFDTVLILTGDGILGASLAEFAFSRGKRVVVAGFPWSTSRSLRAAQSPHVIGNVWFGLDVCGDVQLNDTLSFSGEANNE